MNDIILSIVYIVILIIAGLSVFSSFIVIKNNDKKWFRDYLAVIICIATGFLINLIIQFIKSYSRPTELLENLRIVLLSLTYIFSTYFYLSLFLAFFQEPLSEKIEKLPKILRVLAGKSKWFFFGFSFIGNLICAALLFGIHQNYYNFINGFYIVGCLIIDFLFILKSKEVKKQIDYNIAGIVFVFIGIKVIYYLAFLVQLLLGSWDVVLPSLVVYLVFNLVLYVSNLFYSLTALPRRNTIGVSRDELHVFFNDYSFTPTEKKVLEYSNDGLNKKEIADKLLCKPRTVETHYRYIYKKSKVNSINALLNLINSYRFKNKNK